jgi:ribonuclease BN (tRNA processing enzyme)
LSVQFTRPILAGLLAVSLGCAHNQPCDLESAVQVLGSGGPIPDDGRASAGYLVWAGSRARVLVDAGGGTFQRFGSAGADLDDLEVVALTHLHTDHSADLPALLKGAFFSERRRDLVLAGPSGGGAFPGLTAWTRALFGSEGGAFAYLSWLLDPGAGAFSLDVRELDASGREPTEVAASDDIHVTATGVAHGPVPALAYRVEIGGKSVVFAGDQNGENPHFPGFARGADVLVMHHPVPESAGRVAAHLHARPSEIGRAANDAQVAHLVLSHHMGRSLEVLPAGLEEIRRHYRGRLTVADDMVCVPLP